MSPADEVLRLAASLDQGSEHPLADAIVEAARARACSSTTPETSSRSPASACVARSKAARVALGNTALMREVGADRRTARRRCGAAAAATARRVVYLAWTATAAGLLAVADPIKESTPAAIEAAATPRVRIVMATGDGKTTAEAVARQSRHRRGVRRGATPGQGRPGGSACKAEGRRVAMAGDGINDAPALAARGRRDRDGHGHGRGA